MQLPVVLVRQRRPLFITLAVAFGVIAVLLTFGSENGQREDLGSLEMRVTEAGVVREASIYCGQDSRGTGYLAAQRALSAACVTATISWSSIAFIENGDKPRRERCKVPLTHQGSSVRIRGHWNEKKINRTLTVRTTCDASLWNDLAPLFEPREAPIIVHEQEWQ